MLHVWYCKEGILSLGSRVNIIEITQFPDFSARQQLTDTGELGALWKISGRTIPLNCDYVFSSTSFLSCAVYCPSF